VTAVAASGGASSGRCGKMIVGPSTQAGKVQPARRRKTMARQFILAAMLMALVFPACSAESEKDRNDLVREVAGEGIEVSFYPTYGYRSGTDWSIPIRGWVHENRGLKTRPIADLALRKVQCSKLEIPTFRSRFDDFLDDDKFHEKVTIQFDSDPDNEQYPVGRSNTNGLVEMDLRLSEARARALLEAQGSNQGWLTYRTTTKGQVGKGRIRLIEPKGISVVTDIDDTIKVTEIPGDTANVLRNTFCRDFVAAPGMADMYKELGDVPFHYVSGGPWQLYGPLYDFLVSGPGGYPEGSFHFNYFPKNLLGKDTIKILARTLASSLENTYQHKIAQITRLMERFPGRTFILVGDSGELDPEVYRRIKDEHPQQVREIWIRDVVNDAATNPDRLAGMKIIKSEPVICAVQSHYEKISAMLAGLNRPPYKRNRLPPCDRQ
jgi:uncharacterized protein DUF2183